MNKNPNSGLNYTTEHQNTLPNSNSGELNIEDVPSEIISIIQELSIFSTVRTNMQFIDTIARMMHTRSYQVGDFIIRQGEVAKAVFFIIRGTVNVTSDDGEIIFASLANPCHFGEIALLFDIKRTANVVVINNRCLVTVLMAEDFQKCIESYVDVGNSIRQIAKKRFFALSKDLKKQGKDLNEEQNKQLNLIRNSASICDLFLDTRAFNEQELTDSIASVHILEESEVIPPVFSPQLDAPSMTNLFLSSNAMKPRRSSVAVWADSNLMQMVNNINKKSESTGQHNRMEELTTVSSSKSSLNSICWSHEDSLDKWVLGELSNLPPIAIKRILQYCPVDSIFKLKQTRTSVKEFLSLLIKSDALSDTFSSIDLSQWNKKITDKALTSIVSFSGIHIQCLSLKNCWSITDIGIRNSMPYLTSLLSLNLSSTWEITDEALKNIAQNVPQLQRIDLTNCQKITDTGLDAVLSGCNQLVDICISYCKCITSATFSHDQWQRVEKLNLQRCTSVRDAAFSHWKAKGLLYRMKELILSDCSFLTDETIYNLFQSCRDLRILSLSFCCGLTPKAISSISSDNKLLILDFSFCGTAITDTSVQDILKKSPHLIYLYMRGCSQLTNAVIESIEAHSSLKAINVSQCKNVLDPIFKSIHLVIDNQYTLL